MSEREPLVSVIVPVFNVAGYLDECIQSITGQTYRNLEILLIDDGSTDESGSICEKWQRRDSRIQCIHQENQGLSAARNHGMDRSRGEYFAFVDSDDVIDENFIRILVKTIISTGTDVAMCGFRMFTEDSGFKKTESLSGDCAEEGAESARRLSDVEFGRGLTEPFSVPYVIACNKLYRKEKVQCRFRRGILCEDVFFAVDLFCCGCTYSSIDLPLYGYRIRNTGITGAKSDRYFENMFDAMDHQYEKMKDRFDGAFRARLVNFILCLTENVECDLYYAKRRVLAAKLRGRVRAFYRESHRNLKGVSGQAKHALYYMCPPAYHLLKIRAKRVYA